MWEKLKLRWGVDSNAQMVVIFIVFALTGSSITLIRRPIFELLGVSSDTSLWISVPLYLVVVFPAYSILLLIIGTIFGQFRFFWEFEKKMWSRMGLGRKK